MQLIMVCLFIYPFLKFTKFTHDVIAVYNDNCTGMTLYVCWCDFTLSIYYWLIPCFQIFEDGAAYRGRMKGMARNVVNLYYKDELDPAIEHNHNSDQRDNIIADNVKKLIDNSLFLQGPLDTNVSIFVMNDRLH